MGVHDDVPRMVMRWHARLQASCCQRPRVLLPGWPEACLRFRINLPVGNKQVSSAMPNLPHTEDVCAGNDEPKMTWNNVDVIAQTRDGAPFGLSEGKTP